MTVNLSLLRHCFARRNPLFRMQLHLRCVVPTKVSATVLISGKNMSGLWLKNAKIICSYTAPILRIAISYQSDISKSKQLNHVICQWLRRSLAVSAFDRKHYIVDFSSCIDCSDLNWASRALGIKQTSDITTKNSKPLFSIKIDESQSPEYLFTSFSVWWMWIFN